MSRAVTDLELPCKELALKLVEQAKYTLGVDVVIVHTLRTWEEQAALYAKGRTAPGNVVTNAKPGYSWHNFGLAFDVCFKTPTGKLTWTGPWDRLGELGKSLGLVWGGDFDVDKKTPGKQADTGHFEYHPPDTTLASLRTAHEQLLAKKGGSDGIKWA